MPIPLSNLKIKPAGIILSRDGQIIRVCNATRPRFEIGIYNAPRPRGLCPQRNASAKKVSESAIFREIFRVFRMFFLIFRVFFAFSAFFPRLSAAQKTSLKSNI